jgi:LCP family protein required for cell wall assembly
MRLPKKRQKNRSRNIAFVLTGTFLFFVLAACTAICLNLKQSSRAYAKSSGAQTGCTVSSQDASNEETRYTYNDHLSNYIFMGVDKRETNETEVGKTDAGQADALFLLSWDRVEKSVTVVTIPRDTMTEIETFGPSGNSLGLSTSHISIAYGFGDGKTKSCQLVKDAVSRLFYDIPIQGYCAINMEGIPVLTEVVGGVTITVPDDSLAEAYPEFAEGEEVLLTPENTEVFVRYRDTTKQFSAMVRQQRQEVFLKAFGQKVSELYATDVSIITTLYNRLSESMTTNIGNDIFLKIAEDVSAGGTVSTMTLPGESAAGSHFDEYHVDETALYDMVLQIFYREG